MNSKSPVARTALRRENQATRPQPSVAFGHARRPENHEGIRGIQVLNDFVRRRSHRRLPTGVLTVGLFAMISGLNGCDQQILEPATLATTESFRISAPSVRLDRGDTIRFTVNSSRGAVGPEGALGPASTGEVSWTTSDPSIASISRSGLLIAHREGSVTVIATSGSRYARAQLNVSSDGKRVTISPQVDTLNAIGHILQLSATVLNGSGREMTDATPSWASIDPDVASVDGSGLVTAIGLGTARITATAQGNTDTATIVVRADPDSSPVPASVSVHPGSEEVDVNSNVQFEALVTDGSGEVIADVEIVWTTSDPAIASIDQNGRATGKAFGTVSIRATTEGKSGSAMLSVSASDEPDPAEPADPTVRAGFYVSASGSSGGTGSVDRPWDLQTALSHPSSILAGDTIWLRGGTYRGEFRSRLTGTASAPIVVRQYPGERATIDGSLITERGHTWFWGFEVMSSDPNRISSQSGSSPSDLGDRVNAGITTGSSPGVRFINLVVHDASNGIRFWTHAVDSEIYGAILYNNGWQGPDRSHGHGIYTQNGHVASSIKHIEDVISFNNFSTGMKAYGSGNAYVTGYRVIGNVMFNNGSISTKPGPEWNILLGQESGGRGLADIVASHNVAWHDNATTRSFELGYNSINQDVVAEGNYVRGLAPIKGFHRVTWRNNTVVSDARIVEMILRSGQTTANYTFGGNRYFGSTSSPFRYTPDGGSAQNLSFAQWKSTTGLDGSSSHSTAAPSDLRVIVRPNKYESGRANVTVINPAGYGSVSVDLSSVLKTGDRFEVRNAQDFYAAPVAGGTYGGGSISLPMTGLSVAQPIGNAPIPATPTGPELNVFVVFRID
jgi:uncharacterized protein YjdB